MSKRFTETGKWRDKWFLSLSSDFKLAWIFVCDECDHAGIIDLVEPLANMQIGSVIDWEAFIVACAYRIVTLDNGKLWVRSFCDFQYGTELNPENRAHNSVLKKLEKMGLNRGLGRALQGAMDKDKDKDSGKENKKEGSKSVSKSVGAWVVPETLDSPEVRGLLDEFVAMRKRLGKPVMDLAASSKVLKRFDDVDHLVFALETCIANDYQGLKTDYRPSIKPSGGRNGSRDPRGNLALLEEINSEGSKNGF